MTRRIVGHHWDSKFVQERESRTREIDAANERKALQRLQDYKTERKEPPSDLAIWQGWMA